MPLSRNTPSTNTGITTNITNVISAGVRDQGSHTNNVELEARGGMPPRAGRRARLAVAGHCPWPDEPFLLALGHAAGPAAAAGAPFAQPRARAHADRGLERAGAGAELERRRSGPRLSHRCRIGLALHAHDLPGVDAKEWQLFLKSLSI